MGSAECRHSTLSWCTTEASAHAASSHCWKAMTAMFYGWQLSSSQTIQSLPVACGGRDLSSQLYYPPRLCSRSATIPGTSIEEGQLFAQYGLDRHPPFESPALLVSRGTLRWLSGSTAIVATHVDDKIGYLIFHSVIPPHLAAFDLVFSRTCPLLSVSRAQWDVSARLTSPIQDHFD